MKLTVGAGNDHLKVPAVLSLIQSGGCGESRSPKSALDISEGRRVRASVRRLDCWVPFEVDVEGCAYIDLVALVCTLLGVVRGESVKTQVGLGI